jgi:sialic acid synthase SpsE
MIAIWIWAVLTAVYGAMWVVVAFGYEPSAHTIALTAYTAAALVCAAHLERHITDYFTHGTQDR